LHGCPLGIPKPDARLAFVAQVDDDAMKHLLHEKRRFVLITEQQRRGNETEQRRVLSELTKPCRCVTAAPCETFAKGIVIVEKLARERVPVIGQQTREVSLEIRWKDRMGDGPSDVLEPLCPRA
jgi:hypothetical protein